MNHIYLVRLVVLKRPGFQSQKYGMPNYRGKAESQILFKMLTFLVHGNNRNESIIIILEVEYVFT